MKIVNLKIFRSLPPGIIAMKYEPCNFGRLFVKGETWKHDFILAYLTDEIDCDSSDDFIDKLTLAEEQDISLAMSFEETMRDGMFEEHQLFAVWEKNDITGLINKLKECLEETYNQAFNLTKTQGQVKECF